MVLGLFVLIGMFLFLWYHIERTAKEVEHLNNKQDMEE
jgi:flagellar biogenesis protein FliO